MSSQAVAISLDEEVINEIGTQTLARFGLNIFSLNTYGAYSSSSQSTNVVSTTYNQHKNNDKCYGQTFEDIDVGQRNIKSSLFGAGEQSYTTDTLADIRKVVEINESSKNIANLNQKDREKYDFIMANFPDEVQKFRGSSLEQHASKNDPSTDVVTFDKNGKVTEKSQHKVIKNTKDLLKDRYLENNDVFTVPFDDYKNHKEGLEKIIANPRNPQEAQKAQKALTMLNKNNVTNRVMCENPKTTAILMQSSAAAGHVTQAGLSDAIVVALSTLANGAIFEIKDAFSGKNDIPITTRIKRLIEKVIEEFKKTFHRGASFGVLEIGIDILEQIFKSIFSKIKSLFQAGKNALKSIYNAIYSYITGEIKSFKDLLSTVLKGLFSAGIIIGSVVLEAKLEIFLAPILTPVVAAFIAPALTIVIGSLAVVLSARAINTALNALFGAFAQRDIAKMKAEQIHTICERLLPDLIEDNKQLSKLIETHFKERKVSLEKSFFDFKNGLMLQDIQNVLNGLIGINSSYNKKLQFETFKEFDSLMLSDKPFKF